MMVSTDMHASLDFGYPWWLSYGHLALAASAGAVFLLGFLRKWSKWLLLALGVFALWAASVFLMVRFGVNIDSVAALPTENFLRAGTGQVLDLGAGTGRSTIMLLTARPKVTAVALDLFGTSFDQHFGHTHSPEEILEGNLRVAGVEQRARIVKGDMRKLPFENASFDGIITCYAIDHLGRDGIKESLAESYRVLKPGGEFLMMIINGRDPLLWYAFGPLLAHGGFRGKEWWSERVKESGLQVVESGTVRASFYLVGRR